MAFLVFFILSEIKRDKKSEKMMNFLCLLTAIKFNVTSNAQFSAIKMDASFRKLFLIIVLLSIVAQSVFSPSFELSVKMLKRFENFLQIFENFSR